MGHNFRYLVKNFIFIIEIERIYKRKTESFIEFL